MPLPAWLRRWAAFVLEYIEREARELTSLLKQQQEAGRRAAAGGWRHPRSSSLCSDGGRAAGPDCVSSGGEFGNASKAQGSSEMRPKHTRCLLKP